MQQERIDTVEEARAFFNDWVGSKSIYRGQRDARWSLVPSVFRMQPYGFDKKRMCRIERDSYREFVRLARKYISPTPNFRFEYLIWAQHHEAPTRLLDWTESLPVAFYFACHGEDETDFALWIVKKDCVPDVVPRHKVVEPHLLFTPPGGIEENTLSFLNVHSYIPLSESSVAKFCFFYPNVDFEKIEHQSSVFSVLLTFSDEQVVFDYCDWLNANASDSLVKVTFNGRLRSECLRLADMKHSKIFPGLKGLAMDLAENRFREMSTVDETI